MLLIQKESMQLVNSKINEFNIIKKYNNCLKNLKYIKELNLY